MKITTENLGIIALRKVQRNQNTKLVSLPKAWCDAYDVDVGTQLEFFADGDGHLIIRKKDNTNEGGTA